MSAEFDFMTAREIARRIASYPTTQVRADLRLDPGVRYQNL